MKLPQPAVLLITDRAQAKAPVETVAAAALRAGCRWILLREKDLAPAARLALLHRLLERGRAHDATVMVSADLAAARACGAGLHLPLGGDPATARAALGPGRLLGVSAHDAAEARAAASAGADYVTLSPVFESASKPGYGPALGLAGLRAVACQLPIPVLALGGITAANAASCLAAGAAGVAVMGEVMRSAQPQVAMAEILAALAETLAPSA